MANRKPAPCDCGEDTVTLRHIPKGGKLYVMAACLMCGRCGPCAVGPDSIANWKRLDRKAIEEWNRIQEGQP